MVTNKHFNTIPLEKTMTTVEHVVSLWAKKLDLDGGEGIRQTGHLNGFTIHLKLVKCGTHVNDHIHVRGLDVST